jgi:hypothetical protein
MRRRPRGRRFRFRAGEAAAGSANHIYGVLRIRPEQVAALAVVPRQQFIDSYSIHVADVVLRRRIAAGIVRAEAYWLQRRKDLATFVRLMFDIAPCFDRAPLFQSYLTREGGGRAVG